MKQGDGAAPKPTDTVKVHYTGTLIDGTVFDSSVQRNEPAEFQLDQVIPGWTEGLQKVNKGGKIKLYVPPQLAYGDDPAFVHVDLRDRLARHQGQRSRSSRARGSRCAHCRQVS